MSRFRLNLLIAISCAAWPLSGRAGALSTEFTFSARVFEVFYLFERTENLDIPISGRLELVYAPPEPWVALGVRTPVIDPRPVLQVASITLDSNPFRAFGLEDRFESDLEILESAITRGQSDPTQDWWIAGSSAMGSVLMPGDSLAYFDIDGVDRVTTGSETLLFPPLHTFTEAELDLIVLEELAVFSRIDSIRLVPTPQSLTMLVPLLLFHRFRNPRCRLPA